MFLSANLMHKLNGHRYNQSDDFPQKLENESVKKQTSKSLEAIISFTIINLSENYILLLKEGHSQTGLDSLINKGPEFFA